jgi:glycosyltransferase involved in cell wall biosynthesis
MVSELAAWLHRNEWHVEMVAANRPQARGVDGGSGQAPDVVAMGFRMRRSSPWLVHAFDPGDASAAEVAKAPLVVSLDSFPFADDSAANSIDSRRLRTDLDGARRVICTSRSAAGRLFDRYGCESVVIPDGVDTERLRAIPTHRVRPLVVCPMGDVREQDLPTLVEALVLVGQSVPDLQLAIAGSLCPATYTELMDRIPASQRRQLLVLDFADRKRLLSLYGRASATCMPSVSDGSTRALVESLAVGTPVLCADGGSAAELLDEEAVASGAGLRFAAGNAEECASAIERSLERRRVDEADDVEEACRAIASLYDWSFVGPRLVELYRQAAA